MESITEKLIYHKKTCDQVKNKFKYLKQKYSDKKDNMSDSDTGGSVVRFDYFNEMDAIFGKDPNITPKNIASSSRGHKNITSLSQSRALEDEQSVDDPDYDSSPSNSSTSSKTEESKRKPAKRARLHNDDEIVQYLKERDASRAKRQEQRFATQKEATAAILSIAESLKILVNKK